ncbi:hypothetical protein M8C21_033767 [Ambrosia artemisiifolia]|uniref:Uncharacterized protein n=1 Tax=Ambrosia artemisiifolia TaxID=4212 RepID=A0AAD5C4J2_AMBAR|nr:hypothetical protein M8C21_033767 [Ambrosia artemisiifolia]
MTKEATFAYPDGYMDRVGSRGRIVSWAPQQKVLAHPSIACFMSHCGWNSTLEGITNGIPFLCWPYFCDQYCNESYICDIWKTGLRNLKPEARLPHYGHEEHLDLYDEVLRFNSEAFDAPGTSMEQMYNTVPNKVSERKLFMQNLSTNNDNLKDKVETQRPHEHDVVTSASRKPKSKKKTSDDTVLPTEPDESERQDAAVERFCEVLEDMCGKAEISMDDREEGEAEVLVLHVGNIRTLVKEVMSIRANNFLHLVPVVHLERMLKILDHQIHSAEGLSITQSENSISDVVSAITVALESIHAAIGIMAYSGMPKQIYKEEIIERIVEFSRRQIADVMSACDPNYRSTLGSRKDNMPQSLTLGIYEDN